MDYCSDYGPDGGHYYADENTGQYAPFCSCGALDPAALNDDRTPCALIPAGPANPPF